MTIVASVLVVVGVFRLGSSDQQGWESRLAAVQLLVTQRFAAAWDNPSDRLEFARTLHEAFGAQVALLDASGNELARFGEQCDGNELRLPVERSGVLLGTVQGCFSPQSGHFAGRGAAALAAALALLWGAAALAARRITRPLTQLIAVTREMGAGNLAARVRLGRHGQGELKVLADSVNDMGRRIESQLSEQRELLAVVSHELRSPLARIRVCSELLREDPTGQAALDALDLEVAEVDSLLGKLLARSRLDFDVLHPTSVVAASLMRTAMERHGLDVATLEDTTDGAPMRLDTTLVARALDNLLDNAERHGKPPIQCRVRPARGSELRDGPATVFEVGDAGPGIGSHALPRIFDSFYRTGEARGAAAAGLGLGLALVKRIAEAHGGTAFAENAASGGAHVGFSVRESGVRPTTRSV
jgi:two-component system, OmpR family, sensor kinase